MRSFILFLSYVLTIACGGADGFEEENVSRFVVQQDQFERRANELARQGKLGKPAQAQTLTEPRTGPWTGENQLGNIESFSPDALSRQTIGKLDEWGFPREWTISLGMQNTLTSFDGFSVTAVIEFGAGGSTQTVRCDWLNGTQLTVTANAINVIAEYRNVDINTEGPGLHLSTQFSKYPRPGGIPPRITLMEGTVVTAGGTSDTFVIPPFVGEINVVSAALVSSDIGQFYDDLIRVILLANNVPPGIVVVSTKRTSDLRLVPNIDVTGSAKFVQIRNDSGNNVRMTMYGNLYL